MSKPCGNRSAVETLPDLDSGERRWRGRLVSAEGITLHNSGKGSERAHLEGHCAAPAPGPSFSPSAMATGNSDVVQSYETFKMAWNTMSQHMWMGHACFSP